MSKSFLGLGPRIRCQAGGDELLSTADLWQAEAQNNTGAEP
jgi:hypothetical protein